MNSDILALYLLATDVLMQTLNNPMPTDTRQRKAHELIADATQCLWAACRNLGMITDE